MNKKIYIYLGFMAIVFFEIFLYLNIFYGINNALVIANFEKEGYAISVPFFIFFMYQLVILLVVLIVLIDFNIYAKLLVLLFTLLLIVKVDGDFSSHLQKLKECSEIYFINDYSIHRLVDKNHISTGFLATCCYEDLPVKEEILKNFLNTKKIPLYNKEYYRIQEYQEFMNAYKMKYKVVEVKKYWFW